MSKQTNPQHSGKKSTEQSSLLIDEMRVITPGTQALLGFQFAAFFQSGFEKLPALLKYTHLTSLGLIAICAMLLMAPVSYHRIAEKGQNTQSLHTFASRMVVAAMTFLALGMAADIFVVTELTTKSMIFAFATSILMLIIFYLAWFGYTFFKREAE